MRALGDLGATAVLLCGLLCPAAVARADAVQDLDDTAQAAVAETAAAAARVAEDDLQAAFVGLDAALLTARRAVTQAADVATAAQLGRRRVLVRRRLRVFERRVMRARQVTSDAATKGRPTDRGVLRAIQRAVGAGWRVEGLMRRYPAVGTAVFARRARSAGFHRSGRRIVLRLRPGVHPDGRPCEETPSIDVRSGSLDPVMETVVAGHEDLGGGRIRITLGPDLGGVEVAVSACNATRVRRLFNWGRRGALAVDAPTSLRYARARDVLRVDRAMEENAASVVGGPVDAFSSDTPLPTGVVLDPDTGSLVGVPGAVSPATDYTLRARNARGSVSYAVNLEVGPALPGSLVELEAGFGAQIVLSGLAIPVKLAFAPGGRLFFNELRTGNVRVVEASGELVAAPVATVAVLGGAEQGLLGLALAPDFATSGHLFVYASVPAEDALPDRNQVRRYTVVGNTGTDPQVIVDGLPTANTSNGGDIQIGPDGKLYVSVGDTGDSARAQTDGSQAGRILRFELDGSLPADNPERGTPGEWCRGLRNTFDMTFHPTGGGLFLSENGPNAQDELNFVLPGRNFEWESLDPEWPQSLIGIQLREWTPVIVPTGLTFHSGQTFGAEYADNLFLLGYDAADLRRLVMSGSAFTDIDDELPFARWADLTGVDDKPLDIVEGPDHALYVSTFSTLWKIFRY